MISELQTCSSVSQAALKFVSLAMKFQILNMKAKSYKCTLQKKVNMLKEKEQRSVKILFGSRKGIHKEQAWPLV